MSPPRYFETHCHLYNPRFADDFDEALARARSAGVAELVIVGYDVPSSRRAAELADPAQGLYATAGMHPHEVAAWNDEAEQEIRRLVTLPGVVAIGEIGLDFYRDLSPRELQYAVFEAQLELALELRLPIVVHTRESVSPALDVIEPFTRKGLRGVMHCWSGDVEEARRARSLGLVLGIGGVVTYKKPGDLPEVVSEAPLEELVLETDSPYLPPVPHRGARNEPSYLPLVAAKVAELKALPVEEVAERTTRTARALFRA